MATIEGGPRVTTQNIIDSTATTGNRPPPTTVGGGDFTPEMVNSLAAALGMEPPKLSPGDMMILMLALKTVVEDTQLKTASEDVQATKEVQKQKSEERLAALEEKLSAMSKGNKAGTFGKVFGWIAAAAMVIAGAVLLATGVGTAAGIGLLAGGITMMAVMVLQETGGMDAMIDGMADWFVSMGMEPEAAQQLATGLTVAAIMVIAVASGGAAGAAAGPLIGVTVGVSVGTSLASTAFSPDNLKKMGVPEDQVQAVSMGISIGLAVVAIAASVGPAAVKGVAAIAAKIGTTAAEVGAQSAGKAAEITARTAAMAAKLGMTVEQFQKVAYAISYSAQVIMGVSMVGQGTSQIIAAEHMHDAADAAAKGKELEAWLLKLQQMFQDESERIKEIIDRLREGAEIAMDVLNETSESYHKIEVAGMQASTA